MRRLFSSTLRRRSVYATSFSRTAVAGLAIFAAGLHFAGRFRRFAGVCLSAAASAGTAAFLLGRLAHVGGGRHGYVCLAVSFVWPGVVAEEAGVPGFTRCADRPGQPHDV